MQFIPLDYATIFCGFGEFFPPFFSATQNYLSIYRLSSSGSSRSSSNGSKWIISKGKLK